MGEGFMKDGNKAKQDKGWNADVPGGEEALTTEERSLDIGESGQFAPGGYYNQQTIKQPARRTMDDDIVPPGRH
jgi:hypothetical protein